MPVDKMKYSKYHALGNDYIVLNPADFDAVPTADQIRRICHRNYGIGSDGVLFGPSQDQMCDISVRIFNPDGSEAEKSGNGLRIFARYLRDQQLVTRRPYTILTQGGPVTAEVGKDGQSVTIEMGTVSFDSTRIPVSGPSRKVLNETLRIQGRSLQFCAATIGNPHCIILNEAVTPENARRLGPMIETNPNFPNRTNVQFMKIIDRNNIGIEIWERGAGYTFASGSSSSAAAAVAHKLGLCDSEISVHMPGGVIEIRILKDFSILMTGPVTRICEGIFYTEMFEKENKDGFS